MFVSYACCMCAMSWSLVQRSPTVCVCVCVCVCLMAVFLETSIMRPPRPQPGCCATEENKTEYRQQIAVIAVYLYYRTIC